MNKEFWNDLYKLNDVNIKYCSLFLICDIISINKNLKRKEYFMKKILISIVILIIVLVIIFTTIFAINKENERIDREAVTLKKDLTVEFGDKVKVSDFLENLNGTLVNDNQIDTEKLGDIEVSFDFINIKNKPRTYKFTIKVVDLDAPKIFSGDSFTVKVGYEKKLTDVLLSGDDIDDNPKREIIGEYDVNTPGEYNLTYSITDSSGNRTQKDFILYVKEETKDKEKEEKKIEIDEILEKHKTENTKIGIDVSKWNEEVDWEKVKNAGVEFVIIRMGYQTKYDGEYVIDPYFISNIEGAEAVGLPVGIYFYSYAKNVNQAKEQAEWVRDNLENYKIDLPVAFDWESWNSFNTTGMSFNTLNKAANVFLDTLSDAGYKGMLYGSKTYLEKIWYPTKYEIWLAQYSTKATYNGEYLIWQMTENGKVDGIKGDVDINVMYLDR